jgi:hypothetical protein
MNVTVTKSAISTNVPSFMGKFIRREDKSVNHKMKF